MKAKRPRRAARRIRDVAKEAHTAQMLSHGNFYVPIDEWLQKPRTRILRALRWFDWVGVEDLFFALDVPSYADDDLIRRAYSQALCRLVSEGLVETQGTRRDTSLLRYRLKAGVRVEPPNDSVVIEDDYARSEAAA